MKSKKTRMAKIRIDKIIGDNIQYGRMARDLTRDELAEITDLTVPHIGMIERGERGATPVTLEKISRAFNISIDSLFRENLALSQHEKSNNTYYKKASSFITKLSEKDLEFLLYVIKGLERRRKAY